jgi:predicted alpha/beta superfamily hydrolase
MKPTLPLCILGLCLLPFYGACSGAGDELAGASSSSSSSVGSVSSSGSTSSASSGAGGGGGGGGGGGALSADSVLNELRANTTGTLLKYATGAGWPLPVEGGYLFVSTDLKLAICAGDHDMWAGTAMKPELGFAWIVLQVPDNEHYKFTDKTTFQADPWARSYTYDMYGEISLVKPKIARVDRWPGVGDATLEPRTLRVWVPLEPIKHELYVHDGQNLFNPDAFWGGWHLQDTVPAGMLLVGIDNTPARMDEYTQVPDVVGGNTVGGLGDAYAEFLKNTVRPLIKARYGEPGPVGVMGSSLGGLISFHIADHDPGQYAFAASLSGTMGWGSIDAAVHNQTMIDRYKAHGHQTTVLYLDSGGDGTCFDSDNDGIKDDDPGASDNYCENLQLRDTLLSLSYHDQPDPMMQYKQDLFYVWDKGAMHNEAAWASRVAVPMKIFDGL